MKNLKNNLKKISILSYSKVKKDKFRIYKDNRRKSGIYC